MRKIVVFNFLKKHKTFFLAVSICLLFSVLYSILSIIRHNNYGSYGFDLGIVDQIVWKYSLFKSPITTPQHYPFTSLLTDHVELIYILIAPLYWIASDIRTLLILQATLLSFSALAIFLLAQRKKVTLIVSYSLMLSYLLFYGIQNALWFDIHSLTLAAGFLPWFIYFMDKEDRKGSLITLLLAIMCKEDIALFTFVISGIFFLTRRKKTDLLFAGLSACYLFLIFVIYFPHFTRDGYRYKDKDGLLSNVHLSYLYNTTEKRNVVLYAFASFGFLPILAPLYLLPFLSDVSHYFIIGHTVTAAQGLFMHYRVTLALFLCWPTIIVISRFQKYVNSIVVAVYLLCCAALLQYFLHLPLSYLTKDWFWKKPASVSSIEQAIHYLPRHAAVVSQNNITPHIAHRELLFTLWPDTKNFGRNSPCGSQTCRWFRWSGNPTYLIVDTGKDWDIRHFLVNREEYLSALSNMEKTGYITIEKKFTTTTIYRIIKKPTADPA